MKLKAKISLALGFLFATIIGVIVLSLYYLSDITSDATNILKDNYESIEYTRAIITNLDSLEIDSVRAVAAIEENIRLQENNVTESGEQQLTIQLRESFNALLKVRNDGNRQEIRRLCAEIQDINMKAIVARNDTVQETSHNAANYLVLVGTIIAVVAFTFIVNFPGYIADPIAALTASIKSIANKNYEERLHFKRSDEFQELSEAFNLMAEKLDEYEHGNLAKILFEKKRIEAIINRINDPVIGLDASRRVVFVNDQATRLLDLDSARMIGRNAEDIAAENDLFKNLLTPNITKEQTATRLIKAVVNGRENYYSREVVSITHRPTGEKEELEIGEVILLKDITPFKELDLAKTNFIATISHELKTPIASLQMGIRLLHDSRVGNLNPEQLDIVERLTGETGRLMKITTELLDLAQVESGNIKLAMKPVSPQDVVMYALEAVKFHAERKKVTIETSVDEGLPMIRADLDKTIWVLVNLLTNAIRYSPENERILLRVRKENPGVSFSVQDFGPGIERKHQQRLFEKFYQVPGTASGTGLGLAISKEFIEAQGGSIAVETDEGKGSTFHFTLLPQR